MYAQLYSGDDFLHPLKEQGLQYHILHIISTLVPIDAFSPLFSSKQKFHLKIVSF